MPVRVTQSGIEVAQEGDSTVRVTQSGVEAAVEGGSAVRVTQSGIEILTPNVNQSVTRAWLLG